MLLDDLLGPTAQRGVVMRHGEVGRRWLDLLPLSAQALLLEWDLELLGPLSGGALSMVVRVVSDDQSLVLKMHPSSLDWSRELLALSSWQTTALGRDVSLASPSVVASSALHHATLMEEVVPGTPLRKLPASPVEARLLAPLWEVVRATPAPLDLPTLAQDLTRRLELVRSLRASLPSSGPLLDPARSLWEDPAGTVASLGLSSASLLHGDLVPGNVLLGRASLVVIDPMPVAGEVESDVALLALMRHAGDDFLGVASALGAPSGLDVGRCVELGRLWALDRVRVALTHDFFTPLEHQRLARVAATGSDR